MYKLMNIMKFNSFFLSTLTKPLRKNFMKKAPLFLIEILFFPVLIFCQTGKFVVFAKKAETPPIIDGIINEDVWQNAPTINNFIQFIPERGKLPLLRTVAKILYDDKNIYVAFLCYDSEPEKIQFGTGKRDGLSSVSGTDSVCLDLDTFNDDRSCYYFRTNPLGVQHDGRVSENGRIADTNWDGTWKSAGASIPEGWSAEMAIPLTTLKFQPGSNQTWGLQFSRYLPRRLEKSFWTGPFEDYKKISNNGALMGLVLKASRNLKIIPHAISEAKEDEKMGFTGGLDAQYNLSQFFSGHITVNPDFATVEADQEQVNLTRFELNLPEKRNFFLEGNDVYSQKIRLFYSRRIADIYGGVKIYGKSGKTEINALSAQTKEDDTEGSSANFSVLRFKRDVRKSSTLGFVLANRYINGKNTGALGLDTSLHFTPKYSFTAQFAISYAEKNKYDLGFFIRPSYDSYTSHIHLRYTYLGMHFADHVNAVGFIRDGNRHELDSAVNKTFWLKKGGIDRVVYKSNYNIFWGMDLILRSWDVFQALTLDLHNKFSLNLSHNQEYKLYEKKFRNHSSKLEVGYNTREWRSFGAGYQSGRNFDSDFSLLYGTIKQNLSQRLTIEYNLTRLSLSPDPENKSTWIHVFWVNQYFSKDFFLKLFYQTNSVINKQNIQLVLVYRFQPPFGLVQLAYQKGTAKFGEAASQNHTLFLKLAYVF